MASRLRKRKRNDPPDKWRTEEEHRETMDYKKAKQDDVWEIERKLADDIMDSLKRNGVDDMFKLDHLTKGRGIGMILQISGELRKNMEKQWIMGRQSSIQCGRLK